MVKMEVGVTVEKQGRKYHIKAGGMRVTWDEKKFTWAVRRGSRCWESAEPDSDAVKVRARQPIAIAMRAARLVRTTSFENTALLGVVCEAAGFAGIPKESRLSLTMVVAIEKTTGDLVVSIDGEEDHLFFQHLCWPGPVLFKSAANQETILPFMQGAIIPGRWPQAMARKEHLTYDRVLYMPWWGQRCGEAGYMAILETDADAGCRFEHPAGGPTRIGPWWPGSLGRIAYPRIVRYSFFDRCDYVSLCNHYRRYVMRKGKFVSMREKIAATPKVARLIGSPVIHTGVAHTIHPLSPFFKKTELEKRHRRPFRDVARDLRKLHRRGVSRAYLHLDGWGVDGYDSHHPDYLPPCREIGGWAGLRHLADTCADMGYLFALHDQYRDYYHNAETFDPAYAIHDADGKVPDYSWWYGGPQSVLCARFAPAYVLRNHAALRGRGIRVDGTYLDVFAIVPAEECFHPAHRMNRRECLELRAECFHIIRDLEGIASSEEPVDYAIPHLHLVHHGPYPEGGVLTELTGSEENRALPMAPLWCLVYHDALLLPWSDPTQAALYGGMPYLGLTASDADIAAVGRICRLHAKVALEEMVDHEFLNEDHTRQRTTFADGTVVTADIGAKRWKMGKRSIGCADAKRRKQTR